MKKSITYLAAITLFVSVSCETKKQEGEEYYDPNYKPKPAATATSTPQSDEGTSTPAEDTTVAETPATPAPGGEVVAAKSGAQDGDVVKNAPANKDEVKIAAVPKDKLPASPAGDDFAKGKNLISKSDCLGCHKDDVKLVGPAYVDVANKYTQADIGKLADKIIKGGAGSWGQIPMSPHPGVSKADASEMVKYILSLKK